MRFLRGLVCLAAVVGGVSAQQTINAGFTAGAGAGAGDTDGLDLCTFIQSTFTGLNFEIPSGFPTNIADAPTLPPFIVNCIPQNVQVFFQILFKLHQIVGDGVPTARDWRAAGWPEAIALPDDSMYLGLAASFETFGSAFGSSGVGGIIGGPTTGAVGSGGTGPAAGDWAGNGSNFPGIPDFNKIFDKLAPRMAPCTVSCPPSTLCVNGNQCITPQPICTGCNDNQFCQSTLNTTLLAAFNAQATTSAFASAGQGQGSASAGGGININIPGFPVIGQDGHPQIQIGSNGLPDFNSLLSLIQDGGRVNGTCRSLTPVCTSTSCGTGQVCSPWEGCVSCLQCGNIDLSGVARGGFDPSRFTGNIQVQGNGTAQTFTPGIIAQIQGSANVFSDFVFGASGSGSAQAGSAISAFLANSQNQMNQLLSNIQDATIQLGSNSYLMSRDLRVALNATLAVVLESGAKAGCNTSMNINGPLIIRGVATAQDIANGQLGGVFNFPPRSDGNTIGANAIVNINGGAGLTGDLGSLPLSISGAAAAVAAASVPVGEILRTSGAVLGAEAKFIVRGSLELLNSAFQPTLSVASGAVVNITRGGGNFTCGSLDLSAGGRINIDASGTSTFFKNLTQCAGGASIHIKVSSITAVQSGAILFTYSSTTATIRATYRCGIQLYDPTGAVLSLRNPNAAQAAGRRLLDAASGTATVTWDETGAKYTNTDAGNKNTAAAATQAPTLMVVVTFVAAAMARIL